ncbi:hypothetical protein ABIA85_002131 [Bradyrhizobium sp. LA6.10]
MPIAVTPMSYFAQFHLDVPCVASVQKIEGSQMPSGTIAAFWQWR